MKVSSPSGSDLARVGQTYGTRGERPASGGGAGLPEAGQLLRGRVVSIDSTGLLTVETELGAFKATATSALPVGREFLFQVVQGGGGTLLAEAGRANAALNLLRVMLPGMFGADGAASLDLGQEEAIRAFMADHAVDGRPDPAKLAKTMAQFSQGHSQEGKAASSLPLSELGSVDSPAAQKLSRLIEAHAVVNQPAVGGANGDYVIFPVFFAEQAGRGEWLFSYDRQGDDDRGADRAIATLSFYLAMSRLGDMHLSLTSRQQSLTGMMTLATADAADHVRRHLPALVQALEKLTGGAVAISCRSGAVDCLKALKEDLTAQVGLAERYALIDLRA